MAEPLAEGRLFAVTRRPLLGDCAPSGRVRLDAIARWLQDVAYTDLEDAGLHDVAVWVLRRTRIQALRFPRFGEVCEVRTFCSAIGAMWAERRTTITLAGEQEPLVEALGLWVHLDPDQKLPTHLTESELAIYGASIGDRRVLARLRHPRPAPELLRAPPQTRWSFRQADADVADHVNNAAYWALLEDALIADEQEQGLGLVSVDAEVEFRLPAQPGVMDVVAEGEFRWLVEPGAAEIYASMVVRNPRTTAGSN
jgi:acyl-ACP thioesterase